MQAGKREHTAQLQSHCGSQRSATGTRKQTENLLRGTQQKAKEENTPKLQESKGETTIGYKEKKREKKQTKPKHLFTERVFTYWNKLLCYEISILGATQDLP